MTAKTNRNFQQMVGDQVKLRSEKRTRPAYNPLRWLGFAGMVGWLVVVPMALLTSLGIWLDGHYHAPFSWTLTLLVLGAIFGCIVAWQWVRRSQKEM